MNLKKLEELTVCTAKILCLYLNNSMIYIVQAEVTSVGSTSSTKLSIDLRVRTWKILGDSRETHKDLNEEDKSYAIFRCPAEDHDDQKT